MTSLNDHYSKRASTYDNVYQRTDPHRQEEMAEIAEILKKDMSGHRVLEIACGTGFWTEKIADTATSIIGVDAVEETLKIARTKSYPQKNVDFQLGDAYNLSPISGYFDAGVAMCWFSHIPKKRVQEFLSGFHQKLEKGSSVFIGDNVLIPGSGGEFLPKEGSEDTFKVRTLEDGSVHEILKNYYSIEQLRELFSSVKNLRVESKHCFWWVRYSI